MTRAPRALVALTLLAGSAAAQTPAGSGAPSAAPTPPPPPPEPPAACVEKLLAGKTRPALSEAFPSRGLSGHALELVVSLPHGPAETVLPTGFRFQPDAPEAKLLKQAGFSLPSPDGGAGPNVERKDEGGQTKSRVRLSFVALPKEPGRHQLTLPALPITIARASGDLITLCTQPHTVVIEDPTANTPNPKPKGNPPPRREREEWTLLKQAVTIGAIALVVGALLAWLMRRAPVSPDYPG